MATVEIISDGDDPQDLFLMGLDVFDDNDASPIIDGIGVLVFCAGAPPPTPILYTALLTPNQGPITGGTQVLVISTLVDTADCSDDFITGIGAGWVNVSSGGLVAADLAHAAAQFMTGPTAGQLAALRTIAPATNLDAEVTGQILLTSSQPGGIMTPLAFSLFAGVGTEFRLDVQQDAQGLSVLRMRITIEGLVRANQTRALSPAEAAGELRLRLLRYGDRVIGFFNGQRIIDSLWVATGVMPTIEVMNAAVSSRVVTRVLAYERRPLVIFGSEPGYDQPLRVGQRVVLSTPAARLPGPVDVTVVGCEGSTVVTNGFTYILANEFRIRAGHGAIIDIIDDPTLRNT